MFDVRRRFLCLVSLLVLSLLFLANPFLQQMVAGREAPVWLIALRGFLAPVQMAATAGGAIAIMQLLRAKADRTGLIGGTLLILGWAVGSRIMALGQISSLIANGTANVPPDTIDKLFAAAPIVFVSIVPVGVLFPIALLTLGIAILATGALPRWIGVLLAVGGVMFPLGRAIGVPWAFHAADVSIGIAFGAIAACFRES